MLSPDRIPADAVSPKAETRVPRRLVWLALLAFAIADATILGALGFQYIGGYLPCALCLMQRTPYYVGVPVAAVTALAILLGARRVVVAVLFAVFALLMLYGGGLAIFHSGVEWGFWEGPASCAPSIGVGSAADMLDQLANAHAPSCTDAPWRMLGFSFAGWNVLVSALLVVLGVAGARMAWRESREG
jgi:disulfide bond formation protein DsbB